MAMLIKLRLLVLSLVLVGLAAIALPSTAAAATTYTDSVTGYEVYATSTQGTFAGHASGALPGTWGAVIDHTVLSPSATVTGGSVYLDTTYNSVPAVIYGTVTGGSVVRTNPTATGCVNQYYSISLTLGSVGVNGSGSGSGSFSGTLIHHRASVYGYCVTYSATVSGSLSLTL